LSAARRRIGDLCCNDGRTIRLPSRVVGRGRCGDRIPAVDPDRAAAAPAA